ncbi:MAG: sporulation protein YtfJ [Clostridia bacterium]|nr:sporulation protein YtfJ [Clostridia bacterium]
MEDNRINQIISTSLEKIKELSETGTVIGEQIKTDNGTVIVPISKVSLGFVSGGIDFACAKKKESDGKTNDSFGGGGGTGLSVTPVGFLVIKPDGEVKILNVTAPEVVYNNSTVAAVGNLIEKSPDIIRKLKDVFSKDKTPAEAAFEESDE